MELGKMPILGSVQVLHKHIQLGEVVVGPETRCIRSEFLPT